jgi:peptidoglycan LD-endopeptidase LytH
MRMIGYRKLWTIGLVVALIELTLLMLIVGGLALGQGGLAVTIGRRERVSTSRLLIPVAGVRSSDLKDTYGAARSAGRKHKGIDIFAAVGTPVLAPADAIVVERRNNALGGISLYLRDLDGATIYYYAHLSAYRAGLKEGHLVRRGAVVGYVGRTGNVVGSAHLHFGVYTVTDPNRWWTGHDFNPYQLLHEKTRR